MKKKLVILMTLSLLCVYSCTEPTTVPDDPEIEQTDPIDDPDDPDTPDVPPEKPDVKQVTLMEEFTENFSNVVPDFFDFERKTKDFRYYSGFPSLSENGNTILMLRLDPSDKAGLENGSIVKSKDYVWFGSYSARVRLPDIAAAQAKVSACADFRLFDDDATFGMDEIAMQVRFADTQKVYTRISRLAPEQSGDPTVVEDVQTPSISSFDADSRYYIYGMDWTAEKLGFWLKKTESAEKTIIAENTENVPTQPLRLEFRLYHTTSTQAPLYPFELEIDWIKYKPSAQ